MFYDPRTKSINPIILIALIGAILGLIFGVWFYGQMRMQQKEAAKMQMKAKWKEQDHEI